jgi:hypothetical protein
MDNLVGPFGDEAVAGLIGAAISGFIAILLHFLSRKRPQYLVCEEIGRTSLEIMEEAQEGTEIRYGGQEVERLSLTKLRIHNHGSEALKDAHFVVQFNPEVKIVGKPSFTVRPEQDRKQVLSIEEKQPLESDEKRFHLHFLNAYRPHRQEVIIDFICDGQITNIKVLGSGPGWSVKTWSFGDKKRIRTFYETVNLIFFMIFLLSYGLSKLTGFTWLMLINLLTMAIALWMFLSKPLVRLFYKKRSGISIGL